MTDNELRKLKRPELLKMMLALSRDNDALRSENLELKAQLDDRSLKLQEAGSLAEASLRISGIFEAAQEAADLYLENVSRIRPESADGAGFENAQERSYTAADVVPADHVVPADDVVPVGAPDECENDEGADGRSDQTGEALAAPPLKASRIRAVTDTDDDGRKRITFRGRHPHNEAQSL